MFGSFMKYRVGSYVHGGFVVIIDDDRGMVRMLKLLSKDVIQMPSQVACANARYLASYEDRETTSCFLLFQMMSDFPRKKHMPVVDLRVSGQSL